MSIRLSAKQFQQQFGSNLEVSTVVAKAQIRLPKKRKMTQAEIDCQRLLQLLYPGCDVLYEPWSFKLPSGCRYCPDFVVMNGFMIREVTEAKGSKVLNGHTIRAFKEAKAAFPMLTFKFRQKRKEGWTEA